MDNQLMVILIAAAVVIAGTFVLRKLLGSALKIAGLLVVAFLARRADQNFSGFDWVWAEPNLVILASGAIFGWIVGMVMNVFIFREDGFGRHFFVPLIAVAATYIAVLFIAL
jgi:hypothetical protein